jgi:hypothetical protein
MTRNLYLPEQPVLHLLDHGLRIDEPICGAGLAGVCVYLHEAEAHVEETLADPHLCPECRAIWLDLLVEGDGVDDAGARDLLLSAGWLDLLVRKAEEAERRAEFSAEQGMEDAFGGWTD